ncbi:MAG: hypothetical protein HON23_01395 [Rickettsiales bacterium]|jgi:hypothetical protein|nr:hypothetical protein [Rickettsiales bacterium]
MKLMQSYLKNILLAITLTSCAHNIKDLGSYHQSMMEQSPLITSEDLQNPKAIIVIFELDNNGIAEAEKANLGKTSSAKIENILAKGKLVTIAERNNIKKLHQEIALSEMNSDTTYSGPAVADYAISGKIISAGLEHKFQSASVYYNPSSGTLVRVPPKNKYEASVSGNFKILKLPSLKVIDVIEFKGQEYRFEDAIEDRSFFSSRIDPSNIKTEDNELLRKATLDAIEDNAHNLKNIFANFKRGYIYERRNNGKDDIFLINMGSNDGLKSGTKATLYTLEEYNSPMSEETSLEEIELGQAVVTNRIFDNKAWVIIKDKKLIDNIQIGDFVKVTFKKSLTRKFDNISDTTKGLIY